MTWPNGGQDNWGQQPPQQGGWGTPHQPGPGQQPPGYGQQPGPGQQYQYSGSYGGFGMFEDPLSPDGTKPGGKKWLAITLGVVAVLALVGGVTTAVLFAGGEDKPPPQAAPPPPPLPTSTSFVPPPAPEPVVPGWQVGYNPDSQIAYDVPPDWQVLPESSTWSAPTLGDVTFQGLVNGPPYTCGGSFVRGQVGSTAVEQSKPIDMTANQFADLVGREVYKTTFPQLEVRLEPPRPVQVDGVEAVRVDATAVLPPGNPCLPTEAKVTALVLQAKESFVVVVAAADSAGGVPQPPAGGAGVVGQIIDSVRPVR